MIARVGNLIIPVCFKMCLTKLSFSYLIEKVISLPSLERDISTANFLCRHSYSTAFYSRCATPENSHSLRVNLSNLGKQLRSKSCFNLTSV